MQKKFFVVAGMLAIGGLSLAAAGCTTAVTPSTNAPGNLAGLAQCLADRGTTMYGADWCSHCERQKQLFGAAFAKVPYVECPNDPQRCLQAGVNGYPTWINRGGNKLEGEQSLQSLAQLSGCPWPQ